MKYYSATKRKEALILIHDTTWMKLGNIVLREGRQVQEPHVAYLCMYNSDYMKAQTRQIQRQKVNQ